VLASGRLVGSHRFVDLASGRHIVVGKLGALMLDQAEVVWLEWCSNFQRRTSAAITVAFQSFKGVFGHHEELPYLRR
jgi:hypothetical protein